MHILHRPTLRDAMRAVAACVVLAFALSAMSIAYAAGRQSGPPIEPEVRANVSAP
jgi:hypothetical protein